MAANVSNVDVQSKVSQAVKSELKVPVGHIVVSGRWRKTELVAGLLSSVQVLYEDSLGVVDFHPARHIAILYLSECDIVGATGYRRKCAKLRKAKVRGMVMIEHTTSSSQYFAELQRWCGLEMGLAVMPVSGQLQAAGLLAQMVQTECRQECNVLKRPVKEINVDDAVLATLLTVPRLGHIKAKQLLLTFKSLNGITSASQSDLTQTVGQACGQEVWTFFHDTGRFQCQLFRYTESYTKKCGRLVDLSVGKDYRRPGAQ